MTNNIDTRNWSFAKRALAELSNQQSAKTKKHKKHSKICYWAIIKMPNNKYCKYQLSKDLQNAFKHDGYQKAINYIINSLIVIPTTDFYKHDNQKTYADMTIGQVVFIVKLPHISNPRWITRGQFTQPQSLPIDWYEYQRLYNYLKHDYDQESQNRIKNAIKKLTNYQPIKNIIVMILLITLITAMLALLWHFHTIPIIL